MAKQGVTMTGSWKPLSNMLVQGSDQRRWNRAKEKAIVKEAHRIRKIIIQGFNKGGPDGHRWPRLRPMTQLISRAMGKGDRKPLMLTGDLRNSVSVVQVEDGWFVGVHKQARGRRSKNDMVDIASVHEFGSKRYRIRVTPKMRRFFFWLFKKTKGQIKPLKASTTEIVVRIPPRPFIGPVWEKEKKTSEDNILRDTLKNLKLFDAANLL